jgi:hypothetical protein
VKSQAREKGLTGGASLLEEEGARESGAGMADGWGRSVSGREGPRRERGHARRLGREWRGERGREREGEKMGRNRPSRGAGEEFFF